MDYHNGMARTSGKGAGNASGVRINLRLTLILFALIPLIVSSCAIAILTITKSGKEIKNYTHDSLVQVIDKSVLHSIILLTRMRRYSEHIPQLLYSGNICWIPIMKSLPQRRSSIPLTILPTWTDGREYILRTGIHR